ncbi:MAG: FAD-dependent oxidoreductase [Actinomycetia bacterium]|nr:FAD-dependent oxidoreductase [Actinomycetes bacterium]
MRTVIIGGVAGGMSAATRLRRLAESMDIVVVERGPYVSFANCGLPYYMGGVITDRDALLVQTPASLRTRFNLDVRVNTEATAIDRANQSVRLVDHETGREYTERYDHLVLATGAEPRALGLAGDIPIHGLHTIADADALVTRLGCPAAGARAVVIGAGFIGLEVVENLVHRGVEVTVVEYASHVLPPLDAEMAYPVQQRLAKHGVTVRTNASVASIDGGTVVLRDGTTLTADFIVEAAGVRPRTELAAAAGLDLDARGGILVDEVQRTSDPRIFAVGDAASKFGLVDDGPALIPLAGLANRHGRTAADAIAGQPAPARPALGTGIIGVLGLTVAAVGWSEERLRAAGRAHRAIHTHPLNHAGYYPGAESMALKLLVDPDTDRILGAQAVGGAGVDKRIDVIATAMTAGLRASDLADLELAYAPPYGSAKDAVNMLGYIARNIAEGSAATTQWHELADAVAAGAFLVDVRSPAEFAAGAIPGAVNLPVDELRARLGELPSDRTIIVHCQVGVRAHTAARIVAASGRAVSNLDGGYLTWRAGTAASS